MRLTSLEIKGFKSFGEKAIIHFDKGVTAIVGPNGSGKSNVVDSIRWVLGEQKTRMLRSEKMENIIFNGTKNRKPSSVAEVSMTFENTKNILPTEYSTVTITRRLYRTGESEYLLNNVSCRLKDITDLFLDTGIGSDSYAIIELKMVDEILNDKNNAIKNLLEEAAGISKYKIRRKQTLQKLADTDADLSRVNDLLFEIERNMKSLESQAKKTERYYKLKEQYKELSTELAIFTLSGSKQTFDDLQSQENRQQEERIQLDTQLNEAEAGLQQKKLYSLDKEKELAELQRQLNEKVNTIRQQENDKKVSNEKLKFLQDKESTLNQQLAQDKNNLIATQDQIRVGEEEKFNEELALEQFSIQLNELKSILDETRSRHDQMKSDLHRLTGEAQSIQVAMHESEKSLAVTQARKDSLLKEITRLNGEVEVAEQERNSLSGRETESRLKKESLEEKLTALRDQEEQLGQSVHRLEDELKASNEAVMGCSRKLDARQNEYNLTKSLVENLEGYPESLRYLRKNAQDGFRAPLFSEILSCRPEYKTAIENYLDPFMNYFVIEDVESGSRAVNLLSEASKGRANFFILQNFENASATAEHIANCIPALDILDVEEKYRSLCANLLRNVYIVTEDQERTPFLRDDNKSLVFISQNGKYCKTRHTLSGGSVGLFDGKRIGRAKHLETLAKEIETLTAELEVLRRNHENLQQGLQDNRRQREQTANARNTTQQELQRSVQEHTTLHNKTEHLASGIRNNQEILSNLNDQLVSIDAVLEEDNLSFHEKVDLLRSQFDQINAQVSSLQETFNALTEEVNRRSGEYNQQHIHYIQQQNKIATIVRDLAYKNNLLESLQNNITTNTGELESVQEQTRLLIESSSDFDSQLMELYAEKEQAEQVVSTVEAEYFSSRGEIDSLESKIRHTRHQREQCDQLAQAIKDKTTDLKIQLNSLKERLSVEFGIDINDILDREPSAEWQEDELREKVNKQKGQLDNYGPINPMAIEAYSEINERYTFITTQKEDLIKAKESLLQTIEEIEKTAKENFMVAFHQIRENFIKVFRSLFTEDDDCDLVLLNPENPTESDVQIIAKPKGKRPLSISQLSGGEKTLTATALLFGIYLLKPAPFCIFDEVDAPLDDANIDKFNNIIKTFSKDSQFIIITHNKRTMTATDIIYGITMVEAGITQVVPVDLTEVAEA
ncbi:MAG: chromosome segregation protein [Bacteroidota bacterium]|jgi:chromosome segregation protein